jgi:hypothetical protein
MVSGDTTPGYVTTIAAIVGIGGLQMFMVGVIGEYVGRIYYEVKRRPHYLVKETEAGPLRHQSDLLTISGDHRAGEPAAGTKQSDQVNGVPGARELNGIQ